MPSQRTEAKSILLAAAVNAALDAGLFDLSNCDPFPPARLSFKLKGRLFKATYHDIGHGEVSMAVVFKPSTDHELLPGCAYHIKNIFKYTKPQACAQGYLERKEGRYLQVPNDMAATSLYMAKSAAAELLALGVRPRGYNMYGKLHF